ncbi:MAG: CBS domain-containing protein [Deltaproteobacteria bacterium]|nr:CBS domain-containing protein [Deltaproteobacteria bacterium]
MDVRSIMKPNPVVCGTLDGISECAEYMYRQNVGYLVVLDEHDRCVGVVTDRDVVCGGVAQGVDLAATPVTTIMEREFKAVAPGDSLHDCLKLMQVEGVRRVPVLDNGKCVGIVSLDGLIASGFCSLAEVATILKNQLGEPNPEHDLRPMVPEPANKEEILAQEAREAHEPKKSNAA